MPATISPWPGTLRVFLVRTAGGATALLPPELARVVGSGVEAAILAYLATSPALPEGWVDVDRTQLAASLGTSVHNVRRALGRLRSLGLAEQKRPKSPLWRVPPSLLERLDATPEGR